VDDWRETSAEIIAIGGGSMLPALILWTGPALTFSHRNEND
jgi:hypothetical protein